MTIPTDHLAKWVGRLVQIPSVSPDHAGPRAGVTGEAKLAAQVAEWFAQLGGQVYQETPLPNRPNVYGIWRGTSDRWIAVDVHLDTVGVEQMTGDPFSGRIADGRVYGRGAVDTKASLGVVLTLLKHVQQSGQSLEPNLIVATTIDEESTAKGAPAFAKWVREQKIKLDQLLVAEPTMCTPVYGHKGVYRVRFQIQGKTAHTAQPEQGQNAIVAAAHLIRALEAEHERLQRIPAETPLGPAALTVSMIQGGIGLNIVPDLCTVSVDRRTLPTEAPSEEGQRLLEIARKASPLTVTMEQIKDVRGFWQTPDSPWIKQLADWSGMTPTVATYGTNAWAYNGLAREAVVMGPGSIDQAHGAVEWVAVDQLVKIAEIYRTWWGV